jgi:PP-loop superfamily ATP-utilizing enzyme
MFDANSDLGAALFQTWNDKQRFDEIEKLVQGYRGGVPIGILCKMAETIAGDKKRAKKILKQLLTSEERKAAVESAEGGMIPIVKSFLE